MPLSLDVLLVLLQALKAFKSTWVLAILSWIDEIDLVIFRHEYRKEWRKWLSSEYCRKLRTKTEKRKETATNYEFRMEVTNITGQHKESYIILKLLAHYVLCHSDLCTDQLISLRSLGA